MVDYALVLNESQVLRLHATRRERLAGRGALEM